MTIQLSFLKIRVPHLVNNLGDKISILREFNKNEIDWVEVEINLDNSSALFLFHAGVDAGIQHVRDSEN